MRLIVLAIGLIFSLARTASRANTASAHCSLANQTFKLAQAASSAADDDRALSLYQEAIEYFGLCRPSESIRSTSGLNDALTEVSSQLLLASLFYTRLDSTDPIELIGSATGILALVCNLYVNPPYSTRSHLTADVFMIKYLNDNHNEGYDFSSLSKTCADHWSSSFQRLPRTTLTSNMLIRAPR